MGKVLDETLADLKARHRSVGDARNIGLFSAIELVKDQTTKEPLIIPEIAKQARAQGLSIMTPANMISISPPLIITEPQLKEGMKIIDGLLDLADRAL
jgi:taurine--2-oxoglutarate transaminase